ncbi:hypothetical protein ACSLNH_17005, partial [Comamonas kerstersii]
MQGVLKAAATLALDDLGHEEFAVRRKRRPYHLVAILFYKDFDRFQAAKRALLFEKSAVKYGEFTGPKPPANYGA